MKIIHVVLLAMIANISTSSAQQSSMPPCKGEESKDWNGCVGVKNYQLGNLTYVYTGEFQKGAPNGSGKTEWSDGYKHVGQFKNGLREGVGTAYHANGLIEFKGKFVRDQPSGFGTGTIISGNSVIGNYEGNWIGRKREGQGTFTWPNGMKYVGAWKEDKREGNGTQYWPDGQRYVGNWKENKRDGQGAHYLTDGRVISGLWQDDKPTSSANITKAR